MRYRNQGTLYSVNISAQEVHNFAASWPCLGQPRAIWALFDKRNGDLVDVAGDSGMDTGAVLAMLQDAQHSPANPFRGQA